MQDDERQDEKLQDEELDPVTGGFIAGAKDDPVIGSDPSVV